MVYFGPPRITWSKLETPTLRFHCRSLYKVTRQGATVGGGIPFRRNSVEIISSLIRFFQRTTACRPRRQGWKIWSLGVYIRERWGRVCAENTLPLMDMLIPQLFWTFQIISSPTFYHCVWSVITADNFTLQRSVTSRSRRCSLNRSGRQPRHWSWTKHFTARSIVD